MTKTKISTKVANVFGSFGYFSVIIQWLLFVAIIIFPLLEGSGARQWFLPGSTTNPTTHSMTINLPAGVQVAFGVAAVIFCLLIIIYAIYAIPRRIGKTGRKITQTSAATVIKHVHHGPLNTEQAAHLTLSVTWTMKIIAIILPLALLFLPLDAALPLTRPMVMTLGMVCAAFSMFWFGLQYITATIARTDPKHIW